MSLKFILPQPSCRVECVLKVSKRVTNFDAGLRTPRKISLHICAFLTKMTGAQQYDSLDDCSKTARLTITHFALSQTRIVRN